VASDHVVGQTEDVSPAPLPGAGWRDAEQLGIGVDRLPGCVARPGAQLHQLGASQRPPTDRAADSCDQLISVGRRLPVDLLRPVPPGRAHGRDHRVVVAGRDGVDRAAHQRALHDASLLVRPGQVVALETLDARPQADVRIRRVLVLDADQLVEDGRDRQGRPLQEELAREEGPIQAALTERLAGLPGHGASARECSM
jgi:hypothetical protein